MTGTGPWMLETYKPNQSLTLVRNPHYFVAGLPYIDRVEMIVDEDNASRIAAFLAGKYDLGWEFPGAINRSDWVQVGGTLKKRRALQRRARAPGGVHGARPQGHHRRHARRRYLAKQQYYGPNLGYDYGGRLLTAWLDR